LYLEKQSLLRTAQALNARGWTTKRWVTRKGRDVGGRPFDKHNLFNLLTNPAYLGKVRYKDEVHPGEHEAIVDEAVWQRANLALHANGRSGGMHLRNKYGALLKGLLHCGSCGCAMGHSYSIKKRTRAYRYYVCYSAQRKGWGACPTKSVPAEEIERFVVDQIRSLGQDPALLAGTLAQMRLQGEQRIAAAAAEQRIVTRELKHLHAGIRKAAEQAAASGAAAGYLADLHERVGTAERRLTELGDEQADAQAKSVGAADVRAALEAFDPVWSALSPREQARVLRLLIRRIDYEGEHGTLKVTFHAGGIRGLGCGVDKVAEAVA
jgi:site-specific DNA recombinase